MTLNRRDRYKSLHLFTTTFQHGSYVRKKITVSRQDLLWGAILAYCKAHAVMVEAEDVLVSSRSTRTVCAWNEAHDLVLDAQSRLQKYLPSEWNLQEALAQLLAMVNSAYEANQTDKSLV